VEVGELSEARVHHQGGVPLWNETVWVRLLPSAPFEILLHYPPPPSSSSPLSSPASAEHRPWRMFVKRSRAWIPASWREMNSEVLLPSSLRLSTISSEFYRFVFQFSREGTHKTIGPPPLASYTSLGVSSEKEIICGLMPIVLDRNRAPHLEHFLQV
jgi:hypothetical protein